METCIEEHWIYHTLVTEDSLYQVFHARVDCTLVWSCGLQVTAVKKQIEESQGKDAFPYSQQLLIHQGKVLKDDTTMDDNKVSENGFLVVMLTKVWS